MIFEYYRAYPRGRASLSRPSLAAGGVSRHHQILVIHAPRLRSRLNAALISARWVSAWRKFPCCCPARPVCSAYRPTWLAWVSIFSNASRASTYQNEHAEKVPHDDAALAGLRSRIGDAAFDQAQAWGRSAGSKRAVEYALQKP